MPSWASEPVPAAEPREDGDRQGRPDPHVWRDVAQRPPTSRPAPPPFGGFTGGDERSSNSQGKAITAGGCQQRLQAVCAESDSAGLGSSRHRGAVRSTASR